MMRAALVALALLSPFAFPYPATLLLSFGASLYFPPAAFLVGALSEALYRAEGMEALPIALFAGGALSALALVVRHIAASRIMSA